MNLRRTQGSKHPANASEIERTIFLMFTLGGFGGAASLYISEVMIDPPSNGGAAASIRMDTAIAEKEKCAGHPRDDTGKIGYLQCRRLHAMILRSAENPTG